MNPDAIVLKALRPFADVSEARWQMVVKAVETAGGINAVSESHYAIIEKAAKRFGSRSEAGRYAANIRWSAASPEGLKVVDGGSKLISDRRRKVLHMAGTLEGAGGTGLTMGRMTVSEGKAQRERANERRKVADGILRRGHGELMDTAKISDATKRTKSLQAGVTRYSNEAYELNTQVKQSTRASGASSSATRMLQAKRIATEVVRDGFAEALFAQRGGRPPDALPRLTAQGK